MRAIALLLASAVTLVAVACSEEEEPDPAEVRQEVVRNRLEETFSNAQADCIMARLDDSVLQALDRDGDIDPDGDAMAAYTEAVTSCVDDPGAPPAGTESGGEDSTPTQDDEGTGEDEQPDPDEDPPTE